MHPIRWLHISDIHLNESDAWSQDVVLKAICDRIKLEREKFGDFDFILLTGDIAYQGMAQEYQTAADSWERLPTHPACRETGCSAFPETTISSASGKSFALSAHGKNFKIRIVSTAF